MCALTRRAQLNLACTSEWVALVDFTALSFCSAPRCFPHFGFVYITHLFTKVTLLRNPRVEKPAGRASYEVPAQPAQYRDPLRKKKTVFTMSTRQQVLSCYKKLLKTRLVVFKGDDFAIRESHAAIRDAFEKNRQLTDPNQIVKSIVLAEQAEEVLRKEVMQARFVSEDTVRVNVRLDNVKDNKTFKFIDDD